MNHDKPKRLKGLSQNGMWPGRGFLNSPLADVVPPAHRRNLTPSGVVLVWNVVSPIVSTRMWKVTRKGELVGEGVRDAGGSECRAVTARIEASELPHSERRLTSGRSWITREGRKDSTGAVT